MKIFDAKLTGSVEFLNPVVGAGITASLFGSSSYALTASYALNAGGVGGGVTSFNTRTGAVTLQSSDISSLGAGIISASSFTSPSQGTLRPTINGVAQSDVDLGLQTGDDVTFNRVTATNGLTGSLTASSLIGDVRLGIQTSGDYVSSITAGNGLASTGATTGENISHTLSVNAGAGISVTAPTTDAVNLDTGSVHFLDGVKNELNTEGVISGSVSSPSQGTISVGGFANIDLGLQTGDDVTFNRVTATNGLTGSLTASSLVGDVRLGTQTSGDYVQTLTQGNSITITSATGEGSNPTIALADTISGNKTFSNNVVIQGNLTAQQFIVSSSVYFVTTSFSSGSTIFGNSADDIHQFTGSLRVLGSITGSISASNLVGAITNAQLQNSSVTIGSTNISLGGTSTTLSGLTQVSTTGITGSLLATNGVVSASSFTSPSQGTLRPTINGVAQSDVDLGLQTGDDVTFNRITSTNGLTGSLTASSLIGDIILGNQTSGSFVSTLTQGTGVTITGLTSEGSNPTISIGQSVGTTSDVTFNKVTATTGLTGSLTASSLQGAILNTQLQNSSVTVGNTNISLGGTATTITGLTSLTSTNFIGTASYVTGSIFTSTNPALSASFALTASYALNAGVSSGGGNSFATFSVAGQSDVIAEASSDTLTLVAGTNISITTNAGADSITINSTAAGGGGNSFATFSVAGQNNVIAEIENDTLTLAAGSGISITTNETTDTITITKISDFPYTGSAIISGSLIVTGSARILADGRDGFESFGNVNDYFEIFAQNLNSGISASSDIVAYNDQGTKTQNYVDMGINSTGISSTYSFGKANDAYVYNTGGDLFIGNSTAFYQPTRTSQSLHLFANGPGIPDLTITGSRIGIQKSSSLNATLDVLGNVIISGALHITGSAAAELKVLGESQFTGSVSVTNGIIAQSVTASLLGTASFVTGSIFTSTNRVLSSSYALTASFALNAGGGSGFPFEGEAEITGSILLSTGSAFFPILTASEALTAGDFVNISTGGVRKASNNDITKLAHGYVIEGYSATQPVKVFYDGINPAITGLSIGSRYFLGTSGGETLTPPTAAGSLSQEIGVAVSTTAILVNFKSAIVT